MSLLGKSMSGILVPDESYVNMRGLFAEDEAIDHDLWLYLQDVNLAIMRLRPSFRLSAEGHMVKDGFYYRIMKKEKEE